MRDSVPVLTARESLQQSAAYARDQAAQAEQRADDYRDLVARAKDRADQLRRQAEQFERLAALAPDEVMVPFPDWSKEA